MERGLGVGAQAGSSQCSPQGWLPGCPSPVTGRDQVTVAGTSAATEGGACEEGDLSQTWGWAEQASPQPRSLPRSWAGGKGLGCQAGGKEPGCLLSTAWASAEKLSDPPAHPTRGGVGGGGREAWASPSPQGRRPRGLLSPPDPAHRQGLQALPWN